MAEGLCDIYIVCGSERWKLAAAFPPFFCERTLVRVARAIHLSERAMNEEASWSVCFDGSGGHVVSYGIGVCHDFVRSSPDRQGYVRAGGSSSHSR